MLIPAIAGGVAIGVWFFAWMINFRWYEEAAELERQERSRR